MFKRIVCLSFSPCGSTKKIAEIIGTTLSEKLSIPMEEISFTLPAEREKTYEFSENDLLVIGSPTYAGKIPNKVMPDFKEKIKGFGATAVAFTSFGNRAYENSIAELTAILKSNGFAICAAAAIVSDHSMVHIGKLDPDEVREFAGRIDLSKRDVKVKGDADAPYYIPKMMNGEPAKFLKATPKTDSEKCIKCKLCASKCPMGSINPDNVSEISGICIKCHACINSCPKGAKYFDDPQLLSHMEYVKTEFADPKNSEFFY